MAFKHATKNESGARAIGKNLSVSTKQSIEIANRIKGKNIAYAKRLLEDVIEYKRPIRFTRFNGDMGHKPGVGPGRYPIKAVTQMLKLVKSVESNAINQGMDSSSLKITAIVVHKGANKPRYGRFRGQLAKHSHIEIVAAEQKSTGAEKKNAEKKPATKKKVAEPKSEKTTEQKPKVNA